MNFFLLILGFGCLIILALLILVWYFYRRYKKTRQILNFEINDIRKIANIPNIHAEMKDVTINAVKRYQTLTEDTSAV